MFYLWQWTIKLNRKKPTVFHRKIINHNNRSMLLSVPLIQLDSSIAL